MPSPAALLTLILLWFLPHQTRSTERLRVTATQKGNTVVLSVLDRQTSERWTAEVPNGQRSPLAFKILGDRVLTSSCFSGAYLACLTDVYGPGGRHVVQATGTEVASNQSFVVVNEPFFHLIQGEAFIANQYEIVNLRSGTSIPVNFVLHFDPGCGLPSIVRVQIASARTLRLTLSTECGPVIRMARADD